MTSLTTTSLTFDDFSEFVADIHGHRPFRWQRNLLERVCNGDWPDFIKLPTSSGKTTCIDIAVFALAWQASQFVQQQTPITAPRRIFFVVDRRVIVNEAFLRTEKICDRLAKAVTDKPDSAVGRVAGWLRSLTGNSQAPPLDCFELRGGIYRDDAWVRSLLQPTVLTSTVDQIGSRLLFRGYGVSDRNLPIHAALTANDSLILLDEAHCSKPFGQTMDAIAKYRDAGLAADGEAKWAEHSIRTPFQFTQMTATPGATTSANAVFTLTDEDYETDTKLEQRHACPKPVRLVESTAKGTQQNVKLAKKLVVQAKSLAEPDEGTAAVPCRRIAIVVNRVACAVEAFRLLSKDFPDQVDLMIGRMRPVDRDELTKKLQKAFRSDPKRQDDPDQPPRFVVATQCLEVGADFDFDGFVSQCASLDALRQRYGRLNRLGQSGHARGIIVMPAGDLKPKNADPVYGEALPATWEWLLANASTAPDADDEQNTGSVPTIDFGIRAMDAVVAAAMNHDTDDEPSIVARLSAPAPDALVLLPAHLDVLCQTAPRPAIEPDVANYLHGPDRGQVEVRVCWRADFPEQFPRNADGLPDDEWAALCQQAVAVCPPSSSEVLSVPLARFRDWLRGDDQPDATGDVTGEQPLEETFKRDTKTRVPLNRRGIVWAGRDSRYPAFVSAANSRTMIRPNDTIVLPVTAGGWDQFGHVPSAPDEPPVRYLKDGIVLDDSTKQQLAKMDVADEAFQKSRSKTILRVHPGLLTCDADRQAVGSLIRKFVDDDTRSFRKGDLTTVADDPKEVFDASQSSDELDELVAQSKLAKRRFAMHVIAKEKAIQSQRYPGGIAFAGPRIIIDRDLPRASFDDDFDEHNLDVNEQLSLAVHLADVATETRRLTEATQLDGELTAAIVAAAERHDLGKADPRFQALLLNSTPNMAHMQQTLWAKSSKGSSSQRSTAAHELPRGFRHEMLSVAFAENIASDLNDNQRDLMLHVIAAHHGHARPFAPVVIDDTPRDVSLKKLNPSESTASPITISAEAIKTTPAHRLESGIASRFWNLNRRFG